MKNWILLCVFSMAWNGCDFSGGGTTGGSETTNGLTGIIQDGDGKPVAHAAVVLLPETYNPIPGKDARVLQRTETDKTGAYRFGAIDAGVYNLEAKDTTRHILLLVPRIQIDTGTHPAVQADGVLDIPGGLVIPFSDRHLPENAQYYLPGTTYYGFAASKMDSGLNLVLGNIPKGDYEDLIAQSTDLPGGAISIAKDIHIAAGANTVFSPLQAWLHSRAVKVDAGIASDPIDAGRGYPALLRLNSANFNFTEARANGEDIRFAKTDGTLLPYQIENWDAAAKSAAIWVRLDSVPSAGVDTTIRMHWGRMDAMDLSRGDLVFDTAQGFAAVWHLGEAANTSIGGYHDAAKGGNHATAIPPNVDSRVTAVAGNGKSFTTGGGQMASSMPAGFGGNAAFSVTFWMKFAMTPKRASILHFGETTIFHGFHFLIRADTTAQFGPWDTTPDAQPSDMQNHFSLANLVGTWVHVATVYDPAKGTLVSYINGTLMATNTLTPMDIQVMPGVDFGTKVGPDSDFEGALDEVRFYSRPLSAAWVQMEYATQKENSNSVSLP